MFAYDFNQAIIKEFSVTEVSNQIKLLLENNFSHLRIKGEISGLKIASSGHAYFNLKDNISLLGCICWRTVMSKAKFMLSDGLEVIITGKITAYAGQSKYQLSVDNIEPFGIGAIMQILNERKERLSKEGLFDSKHKKFIPFMPAKVGIITSLTGAVIRDIIHRISDRCPTNIIIWPSLVQGDEAARMITEGIIGFNQLPIVQRPDVLIIARGGGSIEDLWPFNEENVVRAVSASNIPVISAIGHETDYTLVDFAADLRAPTPTAAAEFISPVVIDLHYTINSLYIKLTQQTLSILKYYTQALTNYGIILKQSIGYHSLIEQRIDELGFKLIGSLPNLFSLKNSKLQQYTIKSQHIAKLLDYKLLQLTSQNTYMLKALEDKIISANTKLNLQATLLMSLDYNNVLKRGYAIVQNINGSFITSCKTATINDKFNIRFFDGEIVVSKTNK